MSKPYKPPTPRKKHSRPRTARKSAVEILGESDAKLNLGKTVADLNRLIEVGYQKQDYTTLFDIWKHVSVSLERVSEIFSDTAEEMEKPRNG